MQNNKEKSFRDRINTSLINKVITQEELKEISKENVEKILLKCKGSIQNGKKYILTLRDENNNNPFEITPLEEYALTKLFRIGEDSSYYDIVTILLNDQRVELKWNNRFSADRTETIEVSFEERQNEYDMGNVLEEKG